MKETIKILFMIIFINFFITGCVDIDGAKNNASLELQCSLDSTYIPFSEPVNMLTSTPSSAPTIILLYGESSLPQDTYNLNLALDFYNDGYNVVQPYMPWYSTQWSGTFCESIAYLNQQVLIEDAKTSNNVILMGYGLGGTVALAFSAFSNTTKTNILTVLAPDNFIHQSTILADAHADSIALAKEMLEDNRSDEIAAFVTYYDGKTTTIDTTPDIYLSYHDVDKFPNIESTTPLVTIPLLWLSGIDDPLTPLALTYGIIDLIPIAYINKYDGTLPGDHTTFLTYVSDEFNAWYEVWSYD